MSILKTIQQSGEELSDYIDDVVSVARGEDRPFSLGEAVAELIGKSEAQQIKLLEAVVNWADKNKKEYLFAMYVGEDPYGKENKDTQIHNQVLIDLSNELTSVINKLKGEK